VENSKKTTTPTGDRKKGKNLGWGYKVYVHKKRFGCLMTGGGEENFKPKREGGAHLVKRLGTLVGLAFKVKEA